jgi:hypothetical protein
MTYRGQVKNGVVVLEGGPLPAEGTSVRVEVIEAISPASSDRQSIWNKLLELSGTVEGLPADMAEQHDHYIHGTPKRSSP